MAKSRAEINSDSEAKRGVKVKGFKLKIEDIAFIEQVAKRHGLSQADFIVKASHLLDEHLTKQK